ncbi:hypothetical protein J6590_075830 [Homalodisca vitripennis]|nr:hypothetical protein J6590_075830 [Homalodisca vitripennis]
MEHILLIICYLLNIGAKNEDVRRTVVFGEGLEELWLPEHIKMTVGVPAYVFPVNIYRCSRCREGKSWIQPGNAHVGDSLACSAPWLALYSGCGMKDADLHGNGINSVVWSDNQSWGWNISTLRPCHDCSMESAKYPVTVHCDILKSPTVLVVSSLSCS